jgi:ethanolamine permease
LTILGGAYGIARVTIGRVAGFLVAWFDCYQSMFYTMLSVLLVGAIITYSADGDPNLTPLWWFLIYVSYLIVHTIGGHFFWRTMKVLSMGSLLLLVIYILGSIKFADFEDNAPLTVKEGDPAIAAWFTGSPLHFFQVLPVYCWMFVGVESLNLAAHDAVEPKKDVPKAYVGSYLTVFVIAVATIFISVSVPPGSNGLRLFGLPQTFGNMLIFDIDLKKSLFLACPAIYTSGFTFMYYYSSQVRAMGKSGLIAGCMGYDLPGVKTPLVALIFGAVVGFLVGIRYQFYPGLKADSLFSISLIGAVCTYFSQFFSFISFRLFYPTIKREFVSPLGIAGAIYGMLVFGIILVTLLGLEKSPAIVAFAVYIVVLLIYYFCVVQHRQTFSEEEKTVLFKAYLMKSKYRTVCCVLQLSDCD